MDALGRFVARRVAAELGFFKSGVRAAMIPDDRDTIKNECYIGTYETNISTKYTYKPSRISLR